MTSPQLTFVPKHKKTLPSLQDQNAVELNPKHAWRLTSVEAEDQITKERKRHC